MNTDKFYVYLMKDGGINCIQRLWTDNQGVKDILCKRGTNGVLTVLKSVNNQYAFLLGEDVAWIDVEEMEAHKMLAPTVSNNT